MSKPLYSLTDEHRAQLKPWAEKWIANAMSTKAMDAEDKAAMVEAIYGIYQAAKLPPPKRIVFVPSPFVLRFAGGFAAAILKGRGKPTDAATDEATAAATVAATRDATVAAIRAAIRAATRDATDAATRDATAAATYEATDEATYEATDEATYDATDAATDEATYEATDAATRAATVVATRAATDAATRDATAAATRAATDEATDAATDAATRVATRAATYAATDAATDAATYEATRAETKNDLSKWYVVDLTGIINVAKHFGSALDLLESAENAYQQMWQGGNQWSAWDSYLSFFRHIAKLDLREYAAYQHWESAALHGGPRIMHSQFCMVSDRPEVLKVDAQNRPHCEDGPFCRWRDGSALYALHGVRVPAFVIERPDSITVLDIESQTNAEIRRVMIERYGQSRYLIDSGAQEVHRDDFGTLYRKSIPGDEDLVMVKVVNSTPEPDGTYKDYFMRVPPATTRAKEGVAWSFGKSETDYEPCMET